MATVGPVKSANRMEMTFMTQRYNDIFGIKRDKRVEGWQSLTEFYKDEEVVRTYEQSRFGSGGGRLKIPVE